MKNINEKKSDKNVLNLILLLIGTVAIIFGLWGIFSKNPVDEGIVKTTESSESAVASETNNDSSYDVSSESPSSNSASTNNVPSDNMDAETTSETSKEQSGKVWIDDMQVFAYETDNSANNKYSTAQSVFINTGENLNHVLWFRAFDDRFHVYTQHLDFYLNGQYSSFSGTLALLDESKDTRSSYILSIILDDETVRQFSISNGFIPEKIDLDLSSVTIMRIQIINSKSRQANTKFAFGDAYFIKK